VVLFGQQTFWLIAFSIPQAAREPRMRRCRLKVRIGWAIAARRADRGRTAHCLQKISMSCFLSR